MSVTPLRGDVEKPIGYMSLDFSSEVQALGINLESSAMSVLVALVKYLKT